jgi:hypothetical protein
MADIIWASIFFLPLAAKPTAFWLVGVSEVPN